MLAGSQNVERLLLTQNVSSTQLTQNIHIHVHTHGCKRTNFRLARDLLRECLLEALGRRLEVLEGLLHLALAGVELPITINVTKRHNTSTWAAM